MTEFGRFAARPWTQADDDKLRALALTGASTRAIPASMPQSISRLLCNRIRPCDACRRKKALRRVRR
jgi:hypothetical protein